MNTIEAEPLVELVDRTGTTATELWGLLLDKKDRELDQEEERFRELDGRHNDTLDLLANETQGHGALRVQHDALIVHYAALGQAYANTAATLANNGQGRVPTFSKRMKHMIWFGIVAFISLYLSVLFLHTFGLIETTLALGRSFVMVLCHIAKQVLLPVKVGLNFRTLLSTIAVIAVIASGAGRIFLTLLGMFKRLTMGLFALIANDMNDANNTIVVGGLGLVCLFLVLGVIGAAAIICYGLIVVKGVIDGFGR